MALSEKLCWEILEKCRGQSVRSQWLKGELSTDPPLENAVPEAVIERDLVLRHAKEEIQDSLYFLEKRGYLKLHGFRGMTQVALQLTPAALKALEERTFAPDEQQAFRESILDISRAEAWGAKFNLGELWRRFNKWRSR